MEQPFSSQDRRGAPIVNKLTASAITILLGSLLALQSWYFQHSLSSAVSTVVGPVTASVKEFKAEVKELKGVLITTGERTIALEERTKSIDRRVTKLEDKCDEAMRKM